MSEVAGEEEAIGTEFPVALPLEEERAKVRAEVFRWHWRGYAVQAADLPQMREVRIKIRFPRQHREMRASLGPTQRMQGARVNFAGQREAQLVVGPRCHRVRDFAHTRHPSSSYALYCRPPWLPPLQRQARCRKMAGHSLGCIQLPGRSVLFSHTTRGASGFLATTVCVRFPAWRRPFALVDRPLRRSASRLTLLALRRAREAGRD